MEGGPSAFYPQPVSRVGYYAHHQGHGHLHRAATVACAVPDGLHGLSTHTRPQGWHGTWTTLPDDAGRAHDGWTTARGWLHYAPVGPGGFASRMGLLADWVERDAPAALVADVSVEVALLGRLLGVPTVTVALPGRRDDRPHRLGYAVSDVVVGPWPEAAGDLLDAGADGPTVVPVGAISRFAPADGTVPVEDRHVLVLGGSGGTSLTDGDVARAAAATPGWDWTHLSVSHWVRDPWPLLQGAGVVVSHCGQNAVAEIAAARRPAVLVPQDRPFGEQHRMAAVLRALGMPALVLDTWPAPGAWERVLKDAAELDPAGWVRWNDGLGATRFAGLLARYTAAGRPADRA